ncbi:polysaccharide pyruvyl transferase family protein [Isoptericola chiayiensis]|uniref:polysaccharide pyruvyl transferase family protein n=1 Tax=Isoptericola chiayiensis TaxID=579446 RepID=UPI00155758C5|nr:polysaccharide pyruvyl transferase WcaK-like protein [Isoptericola chiayiensis]
MRDIRPPARPRVALLGQFGIGNLGNEASLDAMLDVLGEDAELVIVTEKPDVVRRDRGISTVSVTDPHAVRGGWRGAWGKLRDLVWAWRRVGEVDAVVVPGTGLLEGAAIRATAIPLTLAWYGVAARCRHRPFHLVSIGVDDGGSRLTRALFGAVLRFATSVTVRDRGSAEHVARLAGARPPVVPDLVLSGKPLGARGDAGGWTVALGVIDTNGTGTVEASWDRDDYLGRICLVARRLEEAGTTVLVVGGAGLDDTIAEEVVARVDRAAVVRAPADTLDELAEWFAGCRVVVAARYHNLVTAVRAGLPVVSLGYARKQQWLVDDLGAPERAHDVAGFDPDLVAEQVLEMLREGNAWHSAHTDTVRWTGRARALLEAQADDLRRDLGLSRYPTQLETKR